MPDRRLPPVRLDQKAQTAKRLSPNPKSKTPRPPRRPRARKPRNSGDDSASVYWIAGGLVVLLLLLAVVYYETPEIKTWLAGPTPRKSRPANNPHPAACRKGRPDSAHRGSATAP